MANWTGILEGAGAIAAVAAAPFTGGATIPTAISLGTASVSSFAGAAGQKAAKQMLPPYEDPSVTKFGQEIDRQRKSFTSGSAYSEEKRELQNQQSAQQQGVLKSQGGNTGATLAALRGVGLDTGNAYGKIAEKGQQRGDYYTQMLYDIIGKQSDRRVDIQTAQYNQSMLDARNKTAFANQTGLSMLTALGHPNSGGKNWWDSLLGGSTGGTNDIGTAGNNAIDASGTNAITGSIPTQIGTPFVPATL